MPYATRSMIQYMHTHGMSENEPRYSSSSNSCTSPIVVSSIKSSTHSRAFKKKRLRELPSSVDPETISASGSHQHHHSPEQVKSVSTKTATHSVIISKSSTAVSTKSAGILLKKSSSSLGLFSKPISRHYSSHKSSNSFKSANINRNSSITTIGSTAKSQPNKSQGSSCVITIYNESASALPYNSTYKTMHHSKAFLKPVTMPGFSNNHLTFDKAKVKFIQGVIRSNVQQFRNTLPFEGVEEKENTFSSYIIHESKPVSKPHSCHALYQASYKNNKTMHLVCKVYVEVHLMHINYFKMLRFIGKKYPTIVMTWGVFARDNKSFYVFQELAPHGNVLAYMMKTHGTLSEAIVRRCGKQIRLAMDWLGDMGVCHRAISPRHLLVFATGELFSIKLTGFRSALVYFNDKQNDIHYQPCIPLDRRSKKADFQAPEIYGDPLVEEFDPVSADVFSYGATLYYLLSGKYPYEYGNEKVDIENEIQQNILKLKVTMACQSVLGNALTTISNIRITVDKLKEHPWLLEQMACSYHQS